MVQEVMTGEVTREQKCHFCGRKFKRPAWFLRHSCPKKKRFEQRNSIVSKKALRMFNYWQRRSGLMKRGKEKTMEDFIRSPFYSRFMELVEFLHDKNIVMEFRYIDWVIERKIPDRLWCSDEKPHLREFKQYQATTENPEVQARVVLNHIRRWVMDKPETRSVEQFFEKLSPGRIQSMLLNGDMTPWVMFAYPPVMEKWLGDRHYDRETFYQINVYVNCDYWTNMVLEHRDGREIVAAVMGELWNCQT